MRAATMPKAPAHNPAHALRERSACVDAAIYAQPVDTDHCTEAGAARLKNRIEQYWRERGYSVQVMPVRAPFASEMRSARVDLRSDMVDGMPRGART